MNKQELAKLLMEYGLNSLDELKKLPKSELIPLAAKLKALTKVTFEQYEPQDYQKLLHCCPAHIRLFIGGNRSGKTLSAFMETMWHVTGLYPDWYPEELRLTQPVKWRWITGLTFAEGIGGVFQPYFEQFVPRDLLQQVIKTQQGFLKKVRFKNGSVLDFLSDEQDPIVFEGWSGHGMTIDEPISENRYKASARGLIDYNGRVLMALTPLSQAWIFDQVYSKASTDPHEKEIFQITRCMDDNKYNTEEAKRRYLDKLNPDEIEARRYGKFVHLQGLVYKEFKPEVHIVSDIDIQPNWRIVHILDPHDRKPHANIWAAVDEYNNYYIIDELEIGGTVPELAKAIKTKEFNKRVGLRIMDPNKSKAPAAVGQKGSLAQEFAQHGLRFYTNINDKIDVGHLAVKKRLYYDKNKKIGVGNRPSLYFFKSCKKTINSMLRYIWDDFRNKDSKGLKEKPKDLYKDFPDCIRYLCMAKPTYEPPDIEIIKKPGNLTGY